jgi:hypothetical protein
MMDRRARPVVLICDQFDAERISALEFSPRT